MTVRRTLAIALLLALAGIVAAAGRTPATDAQASAEDDKARRERVENEATELLDAMRKELGDDCRYRVVRCFAVAGDVDERRFASYCSRTVGACYDAYQKQFFAKSPERACKVYLFRDRASYLEHCKKLFGHEPSTPFGYFSHAEGALVMNIGTGGGTLVHEMFHALVEPDFPRIPAWANEGIASLFEQCRIEDDKLVGLTNWRLAALQKAIADGKCPTLRKVMSLSDAGFRNRDSGIHYAVSRYFMLYLQEKGLLEEFYRTFRDTFDDDNTGIKVAEKLLGEKLETFQPKWEEWVKGLRFP